MIHNKMPKIRPLCKALSEKAEQELGETPDKIESGLANIKEWLIHTPHLNARTDDQFLVAFLRGCKFSVEKVKEKLDMFYTARTVVPGLIANPDPKDPTIEKLIKIGSYFEIPRPNEPDAPVTGMIRAGPYNPNEVTINQVLEFGLVNNDYLLTNNDKFTIVGQVFVYDMKNVTMAHLLQYTPLVVQRIIFIFQQALPIRLKALHYINLPPSFVNVISLARSMLPEKIRQRMYIHKSMVDLFEHFPKSVFPKEYGGDGAPVAEFISNWEERLMKEREELLNNRCYGIDETKRVSKTVASKWSEGLEGNFRRLAVD